MIILPYRVKNPWKHFPYATLAIIALNVLVFIFTSEYCLFIRQDIAETYAYQLGVSPFLYSFVSMFLHADIMHLAGNMLFLWVFAPSVEDRLGIPRFLLAYFLAGLAGDMLQGILEAMLTDGVRPGIGASGCIMGMMGAYWYLFSWSTVCVFYWFLWFFRGVWLIPAFWVIGSYLLLDVVQGFSAGASGGVANFAHVGGGITGALFCLVLRLKRDTVEVSQAKASQADLKDITLLDLPALEVMRKEDPMNTEILRAMVGPALTLGKEHLLHNAFREAGPALVKSDPDLVTGYLLKMGGDHTIYKPGYLLRLAQYAERSANPQYALHLYQLILQHHANAPEHEMALYRTANYYWEQENNAQRARAYLQELLTRYPFGSLEPHARGLLRQIGDTA
ncbi:MAG TPA: rhomboid family intramembrane serine protease [Armatimonadota bacterium]